MREIALHLLDIAENSAAANATRVAIDVQENLLENRLAARVSDNGKGMEPSMLASVTDPFVTSRTTRKVGLGIPLLKAVAEACNGWLKLESSPGKGTILEVEFQRDHIDRMPLGDLAGTMQTLVVAYPQVNWSFSYLAVLWNSKREAEFQFDDKPLKDSLEDIPLCEPEVLAYLRSHLEEGIAQVQQAIGEAELIIGE
jgi:hypothetical protein